MPRPSTLPIAALAMAVALAGAPARAQEPAKDPAKRVKPLTMSLDKVLPLLNAAVVRVRTPSEGQVAAGDATLEAARDGVATTHLTGIRVSNDLAIVAVPDVDPPPASYDVALFDGWLPAPHGRDRRRAASTPCCGFPASAPQPRSWPPRRWRPASSSPP